MGSEKYSEGFKDSIITKVLNRGSQTLTAFCLEENISKSAVYSWMRKCDRALGMKNSKGSGSWTAEEKLDIIFKSHSLSEEELGAFLRREGLHSQQLSEWRAEILKALGSVKRHRSKDGSGYRIRELEKDLHRKDKALAEASALLILQKKVNLIWGKENAEEK